MPNIFFEGPQLPKEKKRELARKFTQAAAEVTGIPAQAFVVTIRENSLDNVAVGGELLSDRQE